MAAATIVSAPIQWPPRRVHVAIAGFLVRCCVVAGRCGAAARGYSSCPKSKTAPNRTLARQDYPIAAGTLKGLSIPQRQHRMQRDEDDHHHRAGHVEE